MVLGAGNSVPLKVLAATFSQASIGQSSKAPFADNTITVTVQPSVILSRGRRSTLTIHGLTGSDTESTRAMPIAISDGSVPPFTSPFSDLKLSFGPGCELANDKVLILDTSDTNYTGTELYSTQGTCKGNKTVITSYNVSTRCATLQSSLCSGMGAVQSVQVIDGGSGYKSGPISIAPGTAGSGLSGNCTVDDMGSVISITLVDGGNGYPDGAEIFCPSVCDTASCGVKSSSGAGAVAKVTVTPDLAAVVAASWDRLTGRLEMRVRGEINTTEPIVMSFVVKNGRTPQASRDVYIMAGGSSPVGSTKMTGTAKLKSSNEAFDDGHSQSNVGCSSECAVGFGFDRGIGQLSVCTSSCGHSNDSVSSKESWLGRFTQNTSVLAAMLLLLFSAWCSLLGCDVAQYFATKVRSTILRTSKRAVQYSKPQMLGLKWRVVSFNQPNTGTEIRNEALCAALHHKTQFSQKELMGFTLKFAELSCSSYVKVGDKYYKPDGRAEKCRRQRWVGGSWGIKEATTDRKVTQSGLTYHIKRSKPNGTTLPAHMNFRSEVNEVTTLFSITEYNQRVKRICYRWSAPLCNALPQKWTPGLTSLVLIAVVVFISITSTGPTVLTGLTASPLTHDAFATPHSSTLRDLWSSSDQVAPTCNLNCSGVISIGKGALDCATDSCRNEDGWCNASAVLPIAGTKQDQTALEDALKSQIHDPLRLHHVHVVSSRQRDALCASMINRTPWVRRKSVVRSGIDPKKSAPAPVQVFQAPFVVKVRTLPSERAFSLSCCNNLLITIYDIVL